MKTELQEKNIFTEHELFFLAGPCTIESQDICFTIAEELKKASLKFNATIIFKASFDKANRTSADSFRGPGIDKGLSILNKVKEKFNLPVITDIHHPEEALPVSEVADILQIPAFLCRQTDLLKAAGNTNRLINIKKGQFMAPADMKYAVEKTGNPEKCLLTERGTFFGYNRLVVDYTGFSEMKKIVKAVVFDATHSVQIPGGGGTCSSGKRDLAFPLARAAICQNINGLFFEMHPDPEKAKCDGPNSVYLKDFIDALPKLINLNKLINERQV